MSELIDRQAAIDLAKDLMIPGADYLQHNQAIMNYEAELVRLPSAQPEPHEGHWIPHESPDGGEQYECSECGVLWQFADGTPEDNEAFYCPKCGVRMKGEANE